MSVKLMSSFLIKNNCIKYEKLFKKSGIEIFIGRNESLIRKIIFFNNLVGVLDFVFSFDYHWI